MQSIFSVIFSDPAAWLKTMLRIIHLFGLVLGVGAATLLDLIIARFLIARVISEPHVHVVEFSSKVVTIGLALLWFSGIGFLIHYGLFDPNKLWNPKVWAKISIVAVLSLNGILVHHFVLPVIRGQVGGSLFDGISPRFRSFLLLSGTVSAISWYVPLLLGAIPQLNFIVPAWLILTAYLLILAAAATVIQGAVIIVFREASTPIISDRGRAILWRGAFAVGVATLGGTVLLASATSEQPRVPTLVAALQLDGSDKSARDISQVSAISSGLEHLGRDRMVSEPPLATRFLDGSFRDLATTAVLEMDGKLKEQAILASATTKGDRSQAVLGDIPSRYSEARSLTESVEKERSEKAKPESYVGMWAVDGNACPRRMNRGGDLLTFIDERGAWAGEGSCNFKKRRKTGGTEWSVSAICTDGHSRWQSDIRLVVSGDKMNWSSPRGSQKYIRCTEKMDVARADNR
jgi:hypothetical protein